MECRFGPNRAPCVLGGCGRTGRLPTGRRRSGRTGQPHGSKPRCTEGLGVDLPHGSKRSSGRGVRKALPLNVSKRLGLGRSVPLRVTSAVLVWSGSRSEGTPNEDSLFRDGEACNLSIIHCSRLVGFSPRCGARPTSDRRWETFGTKCHTWFTTPGT